MGGSPAQNVGPIDTKQWGHLPITPNWLHPETLVDMVLEGCEASALADSGSQVNMMTPEFIQE